jgi:hypothetical protein
LKAAIFAQSGVRGKMDGGLIGRFLIVLFALDRRTEVDHFARLLINQQDVLVSMRFLLATVVGRTSLNKNASITTAYTPGAQTPKSSQRCTHTASPVSGNPRATQTTAQFSTASCIFAGFFRPAFFFSSGSIGAEQ